MVCATRVAAVEEIDAWVRTAKKGDRFVYCSGPAIVHGPARDRAYALYQAGLVDLFAPLASGCAGRDYLLVRRATPLPSQEAPGDAALDAILAALAAAAAADEPCPSNAALARAAALETREQAAWRVAKLKQDGFIRSWPTGDQQIPRVVTIVATGKTTRTPKGWRPSNV
jgi:hypothetical protein